MIVGVAHRQTLDVGLYIVTFNETTSLRTRHFFILEPISKIFAGICLRRGDGSAFVLHAGSFFGTALLDRLDASSPRGASCSRPLLSSRLVTLSLWFTS